MTRPASDTLTDAENVGASRVGVKRMLATPPKPHKDSKLGGNKA